MRLVSLCSGYCGGPWVCPYPDVESAPTGMLWACPNCGSRYRLTRSKGWRPWRNWTAPFGEWVLTLRQPSMSPEVRAALKR